MSQANPSDIDTSISDSAPAITTPSTQPAQTQSSTTSTASSRRPTALEAKRQRLEETLAQLKEERDQLLLIRTKEEATTIVKEHIARLTAYNDIKDVGQGLLGLIAEQKGVRVAEVMKDFDLDHKD